MPHAFGVHKALDKPGAVLGPLVPYGPLSWLGEGVTFQMLFWIALVPSLLSIVVLRLIKHRSGIQHGRENMCETWTILSPEFKRYLVIAGTCSLAKRMRIFMLSYLIYLFIVYGVFFAIDETHSKTLIADIELERRACAIRLYNFVSALLDLPASLIVEASEHFDKAFNLMARGPVFLVQKLLPMMTGGAIVLVSSAMHGMGIPGHTTYAATKAALRSYARTWAAEFKDRGIRVNTLSPGVTDTPILDAQSATREDLVNMYQSMVPIGRLARAEEIASAALFLASDQSSYVTGADLMADCGIGQV